MISCGCRSCGAKWGRASPGMPIRQRSARPTPAPARSAPGGVSMPSVDSSPGASRPPRLPGHPPGRAVGPVHGHRQGRPDHRPARRQHRQQPRAGKRPRPPPPGQPGRQPAGAGMAPPVPGRSEHPAVGAPSAPPAPHSHRAAWNAARAWRGYGGRQMHPASRRAYAIDRTAMAAYPSHLAGSTTGCRWLMLAAEMARVAGAAGGQSRIPPLRAGSARRGSPPAPWAPTPDQSAQPGTSPSPPCTGGAPQNAATISRSWCLSW